MPDRSYYRHEDDKRLIEEAKYNPNRELAIALGERLEEVIALAETLEDELKEVKEDARIELNKLDDQIYRIEQKVDVLELMLGQRDERIAELEAQLKEHKA